MMIEDSACVCKATWLSKACCIATALLFAWSALLDLDFYRLRSLGEKKYIYIYHTHTHIYIYLYLNIFFVTAYVYMIFLHVVYADSPIVICNPFLEWWCRGRCKQLKYQKIKTTKHQQRRIPNTYITHTHTYIYIYVFIYCDCLRVYDIFTCGLRRLTHCDCNPCLEWWCRGRCKQLKYQNVRTTKHQQWRIPGTWFPLHVGDDMGNTQRPFASFAVVCLPCGSISLIKSSEGAHPDF